jgi:RNA polymerase sigma-70 factor (ECF subfamily)
VATNVCVEALAARDRRTLPSESRPPVDSIDRIGPPAIDAAWLEPCPYDLYADVAPSPEARYSERESVALAFLVALQVLPPRQRAVLLLREVVGLPADECAHVLEMSVAAVKSALQRARATLDERGPRSPDLGRTAHEPGTGELLAKYMLAWERRDVDALVELLHDDAALVMPPYREWLVGAETIRAAIRDKAFAAAPAGIRMTPTIANALPACAAYHRGSETAPFAPVGIHVLHVRGERIAMIAAFLDGRLVERFDAPARAD